ncbi:DUF4105 domain-containing protein [bacterium]|nr:DUF4105 domain-containing protein [bacterium]
MKENRNVCPARLLNIAPDGTYHLEGVRWGFEETGADRSQWVSRFKDIQVNPADIKEVYIGVEPFPPEFVAGHGQAVLEFNKPLTNRDGEQDYRMVVSLEAWTKPGESYGLGRGLKKNFGVVYQLGTFADRVQRQARKEGRSIVLHRLNLTQEQKQAFVETSLKEALKDRTGEYYNTATNSCFGAQVANLNQILPEKDKIHRWTGWLNLPRMSATIPGTAGLVLERYHLRTTDNPVEILPDARLHPNAKALKAPGIVAGLSQKGWWGAATRLTGAAAGVSLGASLAGTPGAIIGGVALSYVGGVIGDHLRIVNGSDQVKPDEFYPEHLKAQLEKPPQ